jgi:hypothetical protein
MGRRLYGLQSCPGGAHQRTDILSKTNGANLIIIQIGARKVHRNEDLGIELCYRPTFAVDYQ